MFPWWFCFFKEKILLYFLKIFLSFHTRSYIDDEIRQKSKGAIPERCSSLQKYIECGFKKLATQKVQLKILDELLLLSRWVILLKSLIIAILIFVNFNILNILEELLTVNNLNNLFQKYFNFPPALDVFTIVC